MIRIASPASARLFALILAGLLAVACPSSSPVEPNPGDGDKGDGDNGDGDNGDGDNGDGDGDSGDGDMQCDADDLQCGGDGDKGDGDGDTGEGDTGDGDTGDGDTGDGDTGDGDTGDGDTGDGDTGDGDGDGNECDPGTVDDVTEGDFSNVSDDSLDWHEARMTHYTSYPTDDEEGIGNNGYEYAGLFSAICGKKSEQWVADHNIVAVHSRDFDSLRLKTLRLRSGGNTIDAIVLDECQDSDCDGCCSRNAEETGYLVDVESHTFERFGEQDGNVEWACLNCD